jgi:hypothetical protein
MSKILQHTIGLAREVEVNASDDPFKDEPIARPLLHGKRMHELVEINVHIRSWNAVFGKHEHGLQLEDVFPLADDRYGAFLAGPRFQQAIEDTFCNVVLALRKAVQEINPGSICVPLALPIVKFVAAVRNIALKLFRCSYLEQKLHFGGWRVVEEPDYNVFVRKNVQNG